MSHRWQIHISTFLTLNTWISIFNQILVILHSSFFYFETYTFVKNEHKCQRMGFNYHAYFTFHILSSDPFLQCFWLCRKWGNRKCDWGEKEAEKGSEVASAEVKEYTINAIAQRQNGFYPFHRQQINTYHQHHTLIPNYTKQRPLLLWIFFWFAPVWLKRLDYTG